MKSEPGNALERALAEVEIGLAAAATSASTTAARLRSLTKAVSSGNAKQIPTAIQAAEEASDGLREKLDAIRTAAVQATAAAAFSNYLEDLAVYLRETGVEGARELDGRLYAYPFIVRFDQSDLSLVIGKRRERGLRPSHVASVLREMRAKPRAPVAKFLESLEKAYLLLASGKGSMLVPLSDIYEVLVLRPGQRTDYTEADFLADVYTLDASGAFRTASGRLLRFAASTTTRGGRGLRVVTETGELRAYSAIRFDASET